MKILWDNLLTGATITASSEDNSYPVENLYHRFLEKKFMAVSASTLVTVLFQKDKDVSMIAYGFNNVIEGSGDEIVITKDTIDEIVITKDATDEYKIQLSAGYTIKNSAGTIVGTGPLATGDDVNCTYFDKVTCRSVEILFSSDTIVYVGGLSIGDPITYEYRQVNPTLLDNLRSSVKKTNGGQVIGKQIPMLREWRAVIPDMTNTKRLETREMLNAVGMYKPVFADLYYDDDEEPAMYGNFTQAGQYGRDSYNRDYSMSLRLQEAR